MVCLIRKISTKKRALIILFLALLLAVLIYSVPEPPRSMESDLDQMSSSVLLDEPVAFEQQVKPILERRCVVCHACYDAPCQLKLSSNEGLRRGASEERIYEAKRVATMQPTRLFIDAKSTAQWRSRGFFFGT